MSPRVSFHQGPAAILGVADAYEALRSRLGQADDALTSLPWFLDHAARSGAMPVLALVRTECAAGAGPARGAVLLRGKRVGGWSTGLFTAGERCGRGAVVGSGPELASLAETVAHALVRRGLTHTVLITLLHPGVERARDGLPPRREYAQAWRMRQSRCRLPLSGGIEGVLSRLSYKTRRNVRYYAKKAEAALGVRFLPSLGPDEARACVEALRSRGTHPLPLSFALARERAIRAVPSHVSMGLQDRTGHWVSFLAGWRQGDRTYVEWQLNDTEADGMSLSAVMRRYLIEHEAALGSQEIVFVGETTRGWQQACVPELCGDLLAVRGGVLGGVARRVGRMLRPAGQIESLREQPGSGFGDCEPAPSPPGRMGPLRQGA